MSHITPFGTAESVPLFDPNRESQCRTKPRHRCNAWSYAQSYASLLSKSETLSGHLGGHLKQPDRSSTCTVNLREFRSN